MDPTAARKSAKKLATRVALRRLVRAVPLLGAVVALVSIRQRVQEKGTARGVLDVALDVTPFVGRAKAVYEIFEGDLIPPAARAQA
jgi:hypothetical protein